MTKMTIPDASKYVTGYTSYEESLRQKELSITDRLVLANNLVDGNGNKLEAKVQNGTLIIKKPEVPKYVFKSMLKFGDRGENIKDLQNKLTDLGYFSDQIDGIFGFQTMIAVKKFQLRNNKETTGRVDAETFNAIYNPPKEVQVQNKETEQKASGNKKLLIGGIGILGAYLLMKE